MRVATRWLAWASLMVILFIALYNGKKYRNLINFMLILSVAELFIYGSMFMPKSYIIPDSHTKPAEVLIQHKHFEDKRFGISYDENFTDATKSNVGQVIAGDSLVDTRFEPPFGIGTSRCSVEDNQCDNLVLSGNAVIESWSPNLIKINRTGPGSITLNMNPGKFWLINGRYAFYSMRESEPKLMFNITDTSNTIVVKMQPKYSIDWIIWKINGKY
jgi:hypothetical protein